MFPDTSDDILAKYRKPSAESSPLKENGQSKKSNKVHKSDNPNQETNSFTDVKKKLRLVLGNTSEIPYFIKVLLESSRTFSCLTWWHCSRIPAA